MKMIRSFMFFFVAGMLALAGCGGGGGDDDDFVDIGDDTNPVIAFTAADFNDQTHYLLTDTGMAWETFTLETSSNGDVIGADGLVNPLVTPGYSGTWEIDAQGRLHIVGMGGVETYYKLAARRNGFLETCWGETPAEADACDSPEIWYTDFASANAFLDSDGNPPSVIAFTAADFNDQTHYLLTDTGMAWETFTLETSSNGDVIGADGLVNPLVTPGYSGTWEIDAQGRLHIVGMGGVETYYKLAARTNGFLETCWGETPAEADACDSPEIWYTDFASANAFLDSDGNPPPVTAFTAADFNDQTHYLFTDRGVAWETATLETFSNGDAWYAEGLVNPLVTPDGIATWEIDAQGRLHIVGEAYYKLAARRNGFLETCWGETPAEADACDSPEIWYTDFAAASSKASVYPPVQ